MRRFSNDAGIAIGPILFVIALLAIIGTVLAAGFGDFSSATSADRAYNDIYTQANLIRTKIAECNLKYGTNNNGDGYPPSAGGGTAVCALTCAGDPSTAETGTDCAGNALTMQNLWTGERPAELPPPSPGFGQWYYVNGGASGGRCIWINPSNGTNQGMVAGLTHASTKFSSQEVIYNSAGTSNRFVVWITLPTGTANANCASN